MGCDWFRSGRARHDAKASVVVPVQPPVSSGVVLRVIRVTDEQDGEILNRMYAYWPTAVVIGDDVHVFAGHAGGQPRFFRVDLISGEVTRRGPLLTYMGTSEGWYWDAAGALYLCEGPRLHRVHPFSGDDQVVLDISDTHPGCRLWQAHSSDDGQTHSATVERIVEDGPYHRLGTVVSRRGGQHFFGALGALDESQISGNGRFLVIKEDHDNRIIDLDYGTEYLLANADGALGHSDCGPDFMVGEDDQRGACVYRDLRDPLHSRRVLFETWRMGGISVRGGRGLVSGAQSLSLVAFDGTGLTPLLEHGMGGNPNDYDFQVHASFSPCGRVATYVSNVAGRMDVYLVMF